MQMKKNEQTPILLDISTCTSVHVYLTNTDNLCIILQSNVRLIRASVQHVCFELQYWYSILYAVKLYKKKMRVLKICINQFCYVIFTIAHDYN